MRRAPGTGSVFRPRYKRAGRILKCRLYWIAYRLGDREVREPAKTANRTEAETLLRQRLSALDRGQLPPVRDRATFQDLARWIREDYTANARRSTARLELSLRRLAETFDGDRVGAITTERIAAYANRRLEEGAAAASVNRELAALKRALRLAHRAGRVTAPPYVPLLAEKNARGGFFERAEFGRLLWHLPKDLRACAITAYVTGWRVPSEVLTREWRHVDLEHGWLRLEPGETKSGRGRMFHFTPALRVALRTQRAATTAAERRLGRIIRHVFHHEGLPLVYRGRSGGWIYSRCFREAWLAACASAGLGPRLPHDFRRTAARDLLRAGVPVPTVMQAMGWESQAMLLRYAIVAESDLVEAARKRGGLR